MKSIIPKPLWLVPLATLVLFGAGCFSPDEPAPALVPSAPSVRESVKTDEGMKKDDSMKKDDAMMEEGSEAEPSTPSASEFDLPEIDDTWLTYANRAKTYSFRYPTKGRLAPTWEASIPSSLEDGCYLSSDFDQPLETERLSVGDITFCRTSYMDAATSHRYFTDYYAANVNGQNVLVTFQKELTVGEVIGDGTCKGLVLRGSTEASCLTVDPATYRAHLDQIMSTFAVTE